METITRYMQDDHVLIDGIADRAAKAAALRDWDTLDAKGAEFLRRLRRHIEVEETVLFPAFEQSTGMATSGPSVQMRIEHEQMAPILERMEQAQQAHDGAGFREAMDALLQILQPHNVKEEQMMYPMLDDAVGHDAEALLVSARQVALQAG